MTKDLTTANWLVYMILCDDSSLYTGITTDIVRRWKQHKNHNGAKYFRGRAPQQLVYLEIANNRSSASKREATLKKLTRNEKFGLIRSNDNKVQQQDLSLLES
ncbi:MAG: GIY-YIG nuclease family protein [Pseudomonadales bacterium]|nr:GIY-YIG nuclease family protein [Pseudomonadales bacterium]